MTALAVLSLRSLRSKSPVVANAIDDAVSWLKRRQKPNGSFGGGTVHRGAATPTAPGLAGWALGAEGACRPALRPRAGCDTCQVAGADHRHRWPSENGAIAYARPR